jgi:dihydroorotate dehydrogenase (NAD+) catalytic subunit
VNTAAPTAADLSTSVGSLRLRNPIIAASGTFGYGIEFAHLVDLNSLGAFVVKGLSREPLAGAPAPRVIETPSGMLNAIGLQNIGVRAFVAEKLPVLRKYVEVIRALEGAEGLAGYELNISCPNVKQGGMQFGCDPCQVSEVVGAARQAAANRPLWVKLSPLVTDIGLIARSAAEAGADALTVANTYPAMAIDFRTGKSRLGNLTGGLSGPAIKPITLKLVWEVRKAVKIPIIGLGGVEKVDDVLDYLSVGASAVQVGTASFADPTVTQRLVNGLEDALLQAKAFTIKDIMSNFSAEIG